MRKQSFAKRAFAAKETMCPVNSLNFRSGRKSFELFCFKNIFALIEQFLFKVNIHLNEPV